MESGLPLLHCLLQHTLRSICSFPSSSSSSKWVYAVFWRIVPRNFPPPRWEFGGTALDRSNKGNKRNWILVWEDGFCDFNECEQRRSIGYLNERFGADIFFKMSYEVYSYGEGLVGKVAADNSHKWIYSDTQNACEPNIAGQWNASTDHQPKAWEFQLNSGIQTIVVIAVREGLVQLGSFNKIAEDLDLVINIQRKFNYLQTLPGMFTIQRPYLPIQHPCIMESNEMTQPAYNNNQVTIVNNLHAEKSSNNFSMIAINLMSRNPLQNNGTSVPPLWPSPLSSLPDMSCNLGTNRIHSTDQKVKVEENTFQKGMVGWS